MVSVPMLAPEASNFSTVPAAWSTITRAGKAVAYSLGRKPKVGNPAKPLASSAVVSNGFVQWSERPPPYHSRSPPPVPS